MLPYASVIRCTKVLSLITFGNSTIESRVEYVWLCANLIATQIGYILIMLCFKYFLFKCVLLQTDSHFFTRLPFLRVASTVTI